MSKIVRSVARIVIASDNATDAALVKKILDKDHQNVFTSTDADDAVADCDRERLSILVLAFDSIDKTQSYYLGVCRHSRKIHLHPHRTLLLCSQAEVRKAFDLCRKELFDDYVLFWPMTNDAMRLPMAVHVALRELALQDGRPSTADFAGEARRLGGLESLLEHYITQGGEHANGAGRRVAQTEQEVEAILHGLSRDIGQGSLRQGLDPKSVADLQCEIARIRREEIGPRFQAVSKSLEPVVGWASQLKEDIQPLLDSARSLKALADRVRPTVLVVDDDEMQRKIVAIVLADQNYQLLFAASGVEAVSVAGKLQPDMILMDVVMPGMDGTEATRRLRALPQLAKVPIIMMTGTSRANVVSESIKAGATGFVVKPIERDTLIEKVAEALRRGVRTA